jgi:chemotaxis-related protein WspB
MLFLLFQIGQHRYALDSRRVAEVLPLVDIKEIPHAPAGVAGVFNYRGVPVPVVDLSQLTMGRPAQRRLNTRIVLVHYPDDTGQLHLLGLIVERATETVRRDLGDFVPSGLTNDAAPYLGPVATDARGWLQWIDVAKLLPASMRDVLFKQTGTPDHPPPRLPGANGGGRQSADASAKAEGLPDMSLAS